MESVQKTKKKKLKKPFEWNEKKRLVADEIARGMDPKTVIARRNGIARQTLNVWEKIPAFQEQIQEFREKILVRTDEKLIEALSEQIMQLRNILNSKLRNVKELKNLPAETVIVEFRKYLETAFKVQKGGLPIHHTLEGNINYHGKIQIEQLLQDIQDTNTRESVENKLLAVAGEILQEKEDELNALNKKEII